MERPATSPEARSAFERISSSLVVAGAVAGLMMGMPMLYVGGKGFAGLWGNAMVFKLESPIHAEAMALRGARAFDPSGTSRPMKAWVEVPVQHLDAWSRLAGQALAAAASRRS